MRRYFNLPETQKQAESSIKNVGDDLLNEKIHRLQAYVALLEYRLKNSQPSEKTRLNQLINKACDTLKEVASPAMV